MPYVFIKRPSYFFTGNKTSQQLSIFIFISFETTENKWHTVALPFTLKHLNAKEELWKLKYFTMQKYNLQKNPLKETKILQDIKPL